MGSDDEWTFDGIKTGVTFHLWDDAATSAKDEVARAAANLTYYYEPEPARPMFNEGVTDAWLIWHTGSPGPALAMKYAVLSDGEDVTFEPNGEWQDVTVADIERD